MDHPAHALLAPSSASIWMVCTPSARLCANIEDKGSVYAEEGDLAHKIGALLINRKLRRIREQNFKIQLAMLQRHRLYDTAMLGYCEDYAAHVMEAYARALKIDRQAIIFIESRLCMTRWVPDGFGTADVLIACDGCLWFIDLKYGKGVPVYAEKNKQLLLYALGALDLLELFFPIIKKVSLSIYQPRIDNNSEWITTAEYIHTWGDDVLRPTAKQAHEGTGKFVAGSHCQFCNAKSQCRANAEHKLSLAKHAFKKPELLTDEEIVDILDKYAGLVNWGSSIHEFALQKAVAGKQWPGHKLVAGRSDRVITDVARARKILLSEGYTPAEINQPVKLKGIGDLEKTLGKKDFAYYLNEVIEKPYGAPTLVKESDPRPKYNKVQAAKKAFNVDKRS